MVKKGTIFSVISAVFFCLVFVLVSGCEGGTDPVDTTDTPPIQIKPKLGVILMDEEGYIEDGEFAQYQVPAGQDVVIEVWVQFCVLTDPAIDEPETDDACHYRVFLDAAVEEQQLSVGFKFIHQFGIPHSTITGNHVVIVRLYDHDGEYLGAQESVYITVTEPSDDTTIEIVEPATSSQFTAGGAFELLVAISEFELVEFDEGYAPDPCGEDLKGDPSCLDSAPCVEGLCPVAGKGHYRVYLDDADGDDYLVMAYELSVIITLPADLGNGKHALRASLRYQDGTPYLTDDGGTDDVVIFYVEEAPQTSVAFVSPADGTAVAPGQSLGVEVDVTGFTLLAEGVELEEGEVGGEIRVYLDGAEDPLAVSTGTSVDLSLPADLVSGDHSLFARLYDGEGEALEIEDSIVLVVPSLEILEPAESSLFSPGEVVVLELSVEGFTLVEPAEGLENENGSGHYRVYLDDAEGDDYLAMASETAISVALPGDIAEGLHSLRVSLHENNGDPFGVEASVGFAVGTGIPDVEILAPVDGKTVQPGGNVFINLNVTNFGLVPVEEGKENAFGLGHYHVYLDNAADGSYLLAGHENPVSVALPGLLTPGLHTLRVSLRNNDGTPLGTEDETTLTVVTPGTPVVSIASPLSGTPVADGSEVTIQLGDIYDLTLAPISEDPTNVAGEGHYRVYLDGASGESYLAALATQEGLVTLPWGLTAASHTLTVSLRNNDGSAIDGATDTVALDVWDAPTLDVLSPENGNSYTPGEDVNFEIAISGMALTPISAGGSNQVGEGHYRVYLDGATGNDFLAEGADESFDITIPADTSAGMHILKVSLRNNDGSATGTSTAVSVSIESPELSLNAPVPGTQSFVAGGVMGVDLTVENYSLVAPGSATGPSEGHLRVYLDGADGEDYVEGLDPTLSAFDVPLASDIGYGDHQIRFSLRNDDGSPAGVDTEFFFLVADNGVSIDAPALFAEVAVGGELILDLSFENFTLVQVEVGLVATPGEGHYHVYLDDADGGDYLLVAWDLNAPITIPGNVEVGEHVLRVSLRNNDHTPVDPLSEVFLPILVTE